MSFLCNQNTTDEPTKTAHEDEATKHRLEELQTHDTSTLAHVSPLVAKKDIICNGPAISGKSQSLENT